jgi:hypothetical protein
VQERLRVPGLPCPVVFEHQPMDVVVGLADAQPAEVLRAFRVRCEGMDWGPSTPEHFAQWADYHPALCGRLVGALVTAHHPTPRERLFLRVTVWSRPGDGVWDLPSADEVSGPMAEALGLLPSAPMPRPYSQRWDIHSPSPTDYADHFIAETPGKGIRCYVHPRLAPLICPRLRRVLAYHALVRPGHGLTTEEYRTFTAFETYCHRLLRDTQARR